jgi:tetratricopeptide (TPR) repeat protein
MARPLLSSLLPGRATQDCARSHMESSVIHSPPFRRAAVAVIAALAISWPAALSARAQAPATFAQAPASFARSSTSGSYLAARHAGGQRDAAAAAAYYRAALRGDPRNTELLGRTFLAVLANGDVDEAIKLAERVLQTDKTDRVAHLVLGVRSIKQKQYPLARRELAQSIRGPITDLAATLLSAWTLASPGEARLATDSIDKLTGAEWYAIFKDLHAALILDLTALKKDAPRRFERAYKNDPTALRVVQAYASFLSRQGNSAEALKVLASFEEALPRHPLIAEATSEIKAGKKLPLLIDSPQAGAAEVLYGLGAALGRRGGEDLGLIYLQLALYLAPSHSLALLSLGDLYEALKNPELANKTYERVPISSPLQRNAQIQMAMNLDTLERTDEAKASLEKLIAAHPGDLEAIMALGNVLRGRKQFAECADVYSKGIETIAKPEKSNWVIYYFRGICYERAKQWLKAEGDLKKALVLFPEQPHVLNYLGYSWIDQGVNLDEGMRMIKRAVEQRADDGYIVDSLGWAHYRLGNIEEAVKQLERAVELKPEDPTINDHLGDAYWRVGRMLEARFQWSHARDLKPEPDDLVKIEEKLKFGLPDDTSSAAEAADKKAGGG